MSANVVMVPVRLVPVELERETLASAFRAAGILEEDPLHSIARHAVDAVCAAPTDWFALRDHTIIHRAIVVVHATEGMLTPALVIHHLAKVGQLEDRASLITDIAHPWSGPLAGIDNHLDKVRHFARERAEFIACRDRQAELLGGA